MKYLFILTFLFSFNSSFSQQYWAEQTSGVTTTLTSVSSLGNGGVWVCGYSGVVLRTRNSGTTWTNVSGNGIPNNVQLINICGIDASTALVAGYLGTTDTWIWKTTNSGANWTQVFHQANGFVDGIAMRPGVPTEGIMVGDPIGGRWTIFKTTNAGTTWDSAGLRLAQVGTEASWNNAVYWSRINGATGDSGLWFGTNNFRVYHSTNRGLNWVVQSTGTEQNSYALGFLFNQGQVGGATLLQTGNYGYSFSTVNSTMGTGNFGGLIGFYAPVDNE